jgi:hypothetical protein
MTSYNVQNQTGSGKSGSHHIDKTICFSPTTAGYCHDLVTVAAKGEKREYNFVI